MNIKLLIVLLIFGSSTSLFSQSDYEFGKWNKESIRDDFGDTIDYKYGYINYDKFNTEYLVVRIEKKGLGIYHSDDSNIIKYDKINGPYTVKFKNESGSVYSEKSNMISRNGSLVFDSYSNLYLQLTSGEGKTLSIVIYDNTGERINSFNAISFKPTFK